MPNVGGSSRLLSDSAAFLTGNGHSVTVLTYSHWDREADQLFDTAQAYRVVRIVPERKLLSSFRLLQVAGQLLRGKSFDLIWSGVAYSTGIIAGIAGCLTGTPFAIYSHGEDISCVWGNVVKEWLLRVTLRCARGLFANSRYTQKQIERLGIPSQAICVISPGIVFESFVSVAAGASEALRERFGIPEGQRVLLTIARLVARKGHDTVIRALSQIRESTDNVHYLIIGDGDPSVLHTLAAEQGVQAHVTIVSEVAEKELPALYALCEIYVMVSRFDVESGEVDGFGIVYLEAAAVGKPSVAGNHGGCGDAVEDTVTGYLVDPTNPVAVASAITKLLSDPLRAKQMGKAGQERVREQFRREIFLERLEAELLLAASNREKK